MNMKDTSRPLVSIVTPVYNGEEYLAECVESVLKQSYGNWEYIIVNNCSSDRTKDIAEGYAEKDSRIRLRNNTRFLSAMENHNHALGLIARESSYCKVLHADDFLFPECLEKMVAVAECFPSTSIVGSYAIQGTRVRNEKMPFPTSVISGKEACRLSLLEESYIFGTTPTSVLIRSDAVRAREPFYRECLHADTEACFAVLQNGDYGFVHQVLTYTRLHDEQRKTAAVRYNAFMTAYLELLVKYGPLCLSRDEFQRLLRQKMKGYYRMVGAAAFRVRERDFWEYQKKALADCGYSLNWLRVMAASGRYALSRAFNSLWPC